MNALNTKNKRYDDNFKIIGVPSNQFGLQEPGANKTEILNGLKWVRPGGGFQPNFELTQKDDVNGEQENKMYTFMKSLCPGVSNEIGDAKNLYWKPIKVNDVRWNFEKFLIDGRGQVRYRIASSITPDSENVTELIDAVLEERG